MVLLHLDEPTFPNGIVGIPNETNLLECFDSLFCYGRRFARNKELVLVALALYPTSKSWIGRKVIGYTAMMVKISILDQVLVSLIPLLDIIMSELWGYRS